MADVFLSYSRRDSPFVRELGAAIEQRGRTVWIDTEGIADGDVFPDALKRAIEASDAFVFVITPASASSTYCAQEIEHARSLGKRILPVLRAPVTDAALHEEIRDRNWIPFEPEADFATSLDRLLDALDHDPAHARSHTRWLVRALEWDANERDRSFLLRGRELAAADAWLAGAGDTADPAPTALHRAYVFASRAASTRRQRTLLLSSLLVAAVAVLLVVVALISRDDARAAQAKATRQAAIAARAAAVSRSRAFAAESETQLAVDPELSVLLAREGVRSFATNEAMHALRDAIDASPVRARLPSVGDQTGVYGCACLAPSPDRRLLAESSQQGFVAIINAASGREVRRLPTAAAAVDRGSWSPDGALLAVMTEKEVTIIAPAADATRLHLPAMPHAIGVAFSPDGATVYAAGYTDEGWREISGQVVAYSPVRRSVWVGAWDRRSGRVRRFTLPAATSAWAVQGVNALALSPDGTRLVVGASPGLAVFDTASGRVTAVRAGRWPANASLGTPGPTGDTWTSLDFAPDGSSLVAAVTEERAGYTGTYPAAAVVVDARTLAPRTRVPLGNTIAEAVAFSPDGASIGYSEWSGTAAVYSLRLHREVVALHGLTSRVASMAFVSPTSLATASENGDGRLWRAVGIEDVLITPHALAGSSTYATLAANQVVAMLAPDGGPTAGKVVVNAWSGRDGTPIPDGLVADDAPDPGGHASLSKDGHLFAETVRKGADTTLAVSTIGAAAPTDTPVSLGSDNPVLDPDTGWSPDDRYLVIPPSVATKPMRLYDQHTKTIRPLVPTTCADYWENHVAWDRHSSLLALSTTCGDLLVIDVATGRVVYKEAGLGGGIRATSFGPDSTRLILVGATGPGAVTVIDTRTGRRLVDLVGVAAKVERAAYSPDGTRIVTGSTDGYARIWDARSGALLRAIAHINGPVLASFSDDGSRIVTVDAANDIRVFSACPGCQHPEQLVAIAEHQLTRSLSADERHIYRG